MGTLTMLTILLLSLSPVIGYLLGRFTKEELAAGKKWFTLAKRVLFIAIITVSLYVHKWQLWHMVIGLTVLFAYLAFKQFRTWWFVHVVIAVAYALTVQTPLDFVMMALIFLHGLPAGSVLAQKKNFRGALLAGAVFFAVAAVLQYFL